jgi:hypothetical protein
LEQQPKSTGPNLGPGSYTKDFSPSKASGNQFALIQNKVEKLKQARKYEMAIQGSKDPKSTTPQNRSYDQAAELQQQSMFLDQKSSQNIAKSRNQAVKGLATAKTPVKGNKNFYGSERSDFLVERERLRQRNLGPGCYDKDPTAE